MRIGFISTGLAGTDGVSSETHRLATVLRRLDHDVFYCAGELDGDVPDIDDCNADFQQAIDVGQDAVWFSNITPTTRFRLYWQGSLPGEVPTAQS